MIHRTAKLALLGAFVVVGLSPEAIEAQQRETKQSAASREKARENASQAERGGSTKDVAATSRPTNESQGKDRLLVTPEREAAVMTFIKRNHAELADLLAHLKANQPKEYDRAVRELYRTSERLTQIHDRDRTQYDLELRLWKTQSRIQLLTARIQMGENDALRNDLRALLGEQVENRAALLRHDREKVASRLAKIEDDLKRLEADREKVIDRQVQSLTGASRSKKKPNKSNEARRAAKDSANSSDSTSGVKAAE